ncbi:Ig-like domain-containing protein [Eubacterium oxidoreducens]|uniref:Ig-like domain-containing protein n=1 Tax=Eubacterium oxidoreducens TaxID=1732 RepID=UPI000B7DF949|nr:Ig-like domain-containing protein [Eubacterium oxidoreducens]
MKAVEVRQVKSKRIQKHRKISYEVSNTKVATVTKSGKIKAKKKGKCKIWVYAQNGVYKTITLTVK